MEMVVVSYSLRQSNLRQEMGWDETPFGEPVRTASPAAIAPAAIPRTLKELNAQLRLSRAEVLRRARANTLKFTGKPTL